MSKFEGLSDRSFIFGYNYGAGLGTRLFRSEDGTGTNQEAYQNGANTLPGSDTCAVAQWVAGGGRAAWHNKVAQSLSLFAGSVNTTMSDTDSPILVNASDSTATGAHSNTVTHAIAFLQGATPTTAQRETITDLINAL